MIRKTFRIVCTDGKILLLTDAKAKELEEAMVAGKDFFKVSEKPLVILNIRRDVKRIESIPIAEQGIGPTRQIDSGDVKFDPNSPGYLKFKAKLAELKEKMDMNKGRRRRGSY